MTNTQPSLDASETHALQVQVQRLALYFYGLGLAKFRHGEVVSAPLTPVALPSMDFAIFSQFLAPALWTG